MPRSLRPFSVSALAAPVILSVIASPGVAQTPASFVPFGSGCSSSAQDPFLSAPKLPVVGRELAVSVRNLRPNGVGALLFGSSNTTWGTFSLPLNLGPFGAPNCLLRTSIDEVCMLDTGSGTAFLIVKMPRDSRIVGLTIYSQFVAPDPAANNAGIALSNGATAVIGDCLCLPEQGIAEDFQTDAMLDKAASGGSWGSGKALAARIGGTGRHGTFDHLLGVKRDGNVYEWSTDSMLIPATHTESGQAERVTNGSFEFGTMIVPQGVTVRFVGANAVQLHVRGLVKIDGTIEASGPDAPFFLAAPTPGSPAATGQTGVSGGPGGGRGGQGGDSCPNTGPNAAYSGRPGSDAQLVAGHAYATQAVGTGGRGSPLFPANGVNTAYCALSAIFNGHVGAGGGGGGFITAGKDGIVTYNPCQIGGNSGSASGSGGKQFDIGTLPPRNPGTSPSLIHYSVGGTGGGGGGSHPLLSRNKPFDRWLPGSAGAGGGGICVVRSGRQIDATGSIAARGGAGYLIDSIPRVGEPQGDNLFNLPTPGGGGSGGTVLLQVDGGTNLLGDIDVSGGKGGVLDNAPANQPALRAITAGGDGAPGYVRLETPGSPTPQQLGKTTPPAGANNVGGLVDMDVLVTTQSLIYRTGLTFTPRFQRYVIEASVAGRRRVYSDDPGYQDPDFVGPAAPGQPVQFRIQGVEIDPGTGNVKTRGPWRDNVRPGTTNSLSNDEAHGWRYQLVYDRTTTSVIEVTKVIVWYRR